MEEDQEIEKTQEFDPATGQDMSDTATTLGTITFNKAFPTGAEYGVFFHPSNTNAGGANMTYVIATSKAVGSFICDSSNSNITSRIGPSTAYKVYYHVIQYQ